MVLATNYWDQHNDFLEAAPIGWQLFVLESGKSDSIAFLLLLATYATRLLAQALRAVSAYSKDLKRTAIHCFDR